MKHLKEKWYFLVVANIDVDYRCNWFRIVSHPTHTTTTPTMSTRATFQKVLFVSKMESKEKKMQMKLAWECESPNAHYHHINRNRIPQNGIWMEKLSMWVTQWPQVMFIIAGALVIEMIATTLITFWQQHMEVIICLCLTRWNWLKSVSHPTAPSYVFTP